MMISCTIRCVQSAKSVEWRNNTDIAYYQAVPESVSGRYHRSVFQAVYCDEAEHPNIRKAPGRSMLQRVFGQLKAESLSENTIVCASDSQVEPIGELWLTDQAEVAVEPMRRNTFPAVMLSCAYLLSNKGAKPDDGCIYCRSIHYSRVF